LEEFLAKVEEEGKKDEAYQKAKRKQRWKNQR